MPGAEIVKMSEKGQLVVPREIRETLNLSPGETFAAVQLADGIYFKKIRIPELRIDFEKLAREAQKKFGERKTTRKDVKEAIKWARKKS